jgi:hypothetical protein
MMVVIFNISFVIPSEPQALIFFKDLTASATSSAVMVLFKISLVLLHSLRSTEANLSLRVF